MIQAVGNAFRVPELRRKILFTAAMILVFRALAHIAVPGANKAALDNLFNTNGLLPLIDLFSGGGLSRFSITAMGVNPYINASIIMQLMTVVSERLKEMQKEGEYGRKRMTQYTRRLTVVLGLVQAYGLILLFSNPQVNVLPSPSPFTIVVVMITLTAGTVLLMWLGELITEYGIGNGISLVIFAGIVGRFAPGLAGFFGSSGANEIQGVIIFGILALLVTMFIIYVQQAERRIRIQSAQRMVGRKVYQGRTSHLPLKVNQAGVIPIIFAISIMFFPTIIGNFFANNTGFMGTFATNVTKFWQPTGPNLLWDVIYNLTEFLADHRLHLLLHRGHVRPNRDRRQPQEAGDLHPRHPARAQYRRVPRPRDDTDHIGGGAVPGSDHRRHPAGRGPARLRPGRVAWQHRRPIPGRHGRPDRRRRGP